mmetsp:Transcript_26712/g.29783  ORF Transcript_26712/g.29783 Transcript_26712/m.29783 type:complete len:216 (-) Transcript_26712:2119-2766(-)
MSWAGSKEHQATWGAYQNPQNPQYYNQQYYPGYDANAAYANQAAYQNQHAYAQGYGGYVDPNAAAYYGQVAPGAVVPAATAQQTGEGGEEAETKKAKRLAVHGNRETMNLPNILLVNIRNSDYFRTLFNYRTYHECVDEIYSTVSHVEPWVPGTKIPSAAWCLLYKLFLMSMTENQMRGLLHHKDSPYIRAVGFLYLRLCFPPSNLWSWYVVKAF